VPIGRHGLQLKFIAAGVYALMEASPYPLVSLTYRDIAVQVARHEQAIFDEVQELAGLGWLGLYDRGRGEHDWHPEGCKAATWEVGSMWTSTEVGRQRSDQRAAAAKADRFLSSDDRELVRYMLDQRVADWDDDGSDEVDWGHMGGAPSDDHAEWVAGWEPDTRQDVFEARTPWVKLLGDSDKDRCQDLVSSYAGIYKEKYSYLKMYTPSRGNDISAFPATAMSPIDYGTWGDCFREDQAGVPGWALARLQIRDMQPHGNDVEDHLGPVDGAEAGRLLGLTRQAGLTLLKRLAKAGYAARLPDGRYRLLFADLYSGGRLLRDDHALSLAEHNRRATVQRDARAAGEGPNQNPRPMGGFSWEADVFGPDGAAGGAASD
jgi:hypothetical protein